MLKECKNRRQSFSSKMRSSSAAIFFSAPECIRSRDIEYPYRQNSDFFYLTNFTEPKAVLILVKKQDHSVYSVIFNRSQDLEKERWLGEFLGQKNVSKTLGIDYAFDIEKIKDHLIKIISGSHYIYHAYGEYSYADNILFSTLHMIQKNNGTSPLSIVDWRPLVHEMRLFKSKKEIKLIKKACNITSLGHLTAMKMCRPGIYEYQLDSEIHYACSYNGASSAYNSIIAGGKNSCTLHYNKKNSVLCGKELVLVDIGYEYNGYSSDITRTFPINGKFTRPQLTVYNIVLESLNYALKNYRPGVSIEKIYHEIACIILKGLISADILRGNFKTLIARNAQKEFFMHGLSHWLGLDVHDVGQYGENKSRILEPGMVLTVEPAIYIPSSSSIPRDYHNIGVRLEDNILITENGNENFSPNLKHPYEIKKIMNIT